MSETHHQHLERMRALAARTTLLRVRRVVPPHGPVFWDVQGGSRSTGGGLEVHSIATFVRRSDAVAFFRSARILGAQLRSSRRRHSSTPSQADHERFPA